MAEAFARYQQEYAARGIATFPFCAEHKRPLVRSYDEIGITASGQLVWKFPDADGLACVAGKRNRLTVVDVDARGAEGERLAADIQSAIGPSKFIVRTGRLGLHLYYRFNNEARQIRVGNKPIDLLGKGPIVLPPSKGIVAPYQIIHGTLDDLTALSPISAQTSAANDNGSRFEELRGAQVGERDKKLRPYIARRAKVVASLDELVLVVRELNELVSPPLSDSEIVAKCNYWWKKTQKGENRFGVGRFIMTDHALVDNLMLTDPDAFLLLTFLQRTHWNRDFRLANATADLLPLNGSKRGQVGWDRERFASARSRLIEGGFLKVITPQRFNPNRPMVCRLVKRSMAS